MIVFLDFDGVVVDSIEECYQVSFETYFGYAKFAFSEIEYKNLFYKYRGLVGPAREYLCLHRAIEEYLMIVNGEACDHINGLFHKAVAQVHVDEADNFEKKFFYTRSLYQERDFYGWIELNPLTEFGKSLVNQVNDNVYIITTKNRHATEAILGYYRIPVKAIYANDEIKQARNKGALISELLDKNSEEEAIFIDDNVAHLNSVKDNRVSCFFAGWGYGENTSYQEYEF
ncbi:MAG: hypothetical protein PVJ39_06710 [Gammaproteobacteria bacterium]|jgi:phosphoglycolate phosphatase-like HAD superfamily hydrolase